MDHPRIVVLADGFHDGRAYLRAHPEADFAAIRPADLQGLPIGKVTETPQFAELRTARAEDLRRAAAQRLNRSFFRKAPAMDLAPTVARIVHYQSLGSADGQFPPEARAAIITAVHEPGYSKSNVSLAVINPTGIFLPLSVPFADEPTAGHWNWPPRT